MRKAIIVIAALALFSITFVYLNQQHVGIPFTHKWRKSRQCLAYAKRSGEKFLSGSSEPIQTETFFSERLGTCVQAQTFSPGDYSIVDLSRGYSDNDWLFICGPQGLYKASFSDRTGGKWIEEGRRADRPCESLYKQTLGEIR